MYKFDFREKMPCSPKTLADEILFNFDNYAKYAPNVTRAEELSREKQPDGREKITLQVFAEGWLPPVARTFFNAKEVSWKEFYIVNYEDFSTEWKIETPVFNEYVDCRGVSITEPRPGGCELIITGTMTVGVPPIPGVPRSIVQSIVSAVEQFVGKLVIVNLKKYFDNVRKDIVRKGVK